MVRREFPEDFLWGVATSAQQIEGSTRQDGRGESIWDRFAATAGKIEDGTNPEVTCDHYRRWPEDIQLMKQLGLGAYRFSLAWPRIFPQGSGTVNPAGLEFYERLVDNLLEAGIQPFPTLYHWDLPQALQESGGWANRDTIHRFVDYATTVTEQLGDRVKHWVTHNEPWCIATLGHEEGCHAPGHNNPAESLQVAHHLMLSHGLAARAMRENMADLKLGIVLIPCPAQPRTDCETDRDAARWFDGFFNRWYLDPIFKGQYPADAVADRVAAGHLPAGELPFVQPGDMEIISTPLDFLGLNYYSRSVQETGPEGQRQAFIPVPQEELTDMGWEVYPDGLQESLLRVQRDYNPPAIYIMENGAAYTDPVQPDGTIQDQRRINYLREHLLAAHRAIGEGSPLRGYFSWSLLDNFEWGLGFSKKFGLFALDGQTQDRIPKDSAQWYRDVVVSNAVDDTSFSTSQGD